jgi:hypothetical protein
MDAKHLTEALARCDAAGDALDCFRLEVTACGAAGQDLAGEVGGIGRAVSAESSKIRRLRGAARSYGL